MRLLIVHYGLFDSNSGIQAFHFANLLSEAGWEVTLACEGETDRVARVGVPRFECIDRAGLAPKLEQWRSDPRASLIFAWTPRENVRREVAAFSSGLGVPYVVHLEDNEEHLLSAAVGMPIEELRALPSPVQDELSPDDLVHPARWPGFLRGAAGVTVITEELSELNLAGRPHHLARPGVDLERFRPGLEPVLRRELLGLAPEDFVLVYHGTTHYANQHEMLSLYLAVKLLQREGLAVKLVQVGSTVHGGLDPRSARAVADSVVEVGVVPWKEVPGYLALADGFVQPGAPNEFNRYRLPSKLPEFLAMGRPVILPRCNIGNELIDREDAILLEVGTALEIAEGLRELIADPELAARLGRGAREFARTHLDWGRSAAGLSGFFRELIAAADPAEEAAELGPA